MPSSVAICGVLTALTETFGTSAHAKHSANQASTLRAVHAWGTLVEDSVLACPCEHPRDTNEPPQSRRCVRPQSFDPARALLKFK